MFMVSVLSLLEVCVLILSYSWLWTVSSHIIYIREHPIRTSSKITYILMTGISKMKLQIFFKLMTQSQYAVALGKMVWIRSVQKTVGDTRGFLGSAQTIQSYLRLTRKERCITGHIESRITQEACLQWRCLTSSHKILIQKVWGGGARDLYFNNHYKWVRGRWSPLLDRHQVDEKYNIHIGYLHQHFVCLQKFQNSF